LNKPLKILIIGCNGFIGSNAYSFFKSIHYQTYGADISAGGNATFILKQDLSNIKELLQIHHFDVCINASGGATVGFSISNPEEDYLLNYLNVEKIGQCFASYQPQCKFINLSSAAVYGNPIELPVKENSLTQPISPYGKHKLMSEQLLLKYHKQYALPTISLRIFSVYGNGLKKQLFWDIYQKTLKDNIIALQGTGNETRDFIHIHDLMRAFEVIVNKADFTGGVINVASGKSYSIREAAVCMLAHLNEKALVEFTGTAHAGNPSFWLADITRLSAIDFKPQVSLDNGLNQYATWLKGLN
jgi:dTDP-glucose 4,6-dehydratase/UDP-glucose 4-epimerase